MRTNALAHCAGRAARPRPTMSDASPMDVDNAATAPRRSRRVNTVIAAAALLIATFLQQQNAASCFAETASPTGFQMEAEPVAATGSARTSLLVNYVARVGAQRLLRLAQAGVLLPPATRRPNLARPDWDQSSLNLILTQWPDDAFARIMHMTRPAFTHIVDTFRFHNVLQDNQCRNPKFRYSAAFKFGLCQWHLAYGGTLVQTAVCGGVSTATVQKYLTLGQGLITLVPRFW